MQDGVEVEVAVEDVKGIGTKNVMLLAEQDGERALDTTMLLRTSMPRQSVAG